MSSGISGSDGGFKNIESQIRGKVRITDGEQRKVKGFIKILADSTGWQFVEDAWSFEDLKPYKFTKGSFEGRGWTISDRDFEKFIRLNPLSWAMTSGQNIEFTLEDPDLLP